MSILFTPHDYQKTAIQAIIENDNYGLFLDMGLGKSIITLSAIEKLIYDYFDIQKVLIVAPKKVAQSTWSQEALKWEHTKHLRVSKILGSSEERRKAYYKDADIYVINRENIPWLFSNFSNKFDMLVIDESSSFKNPQAKRFKALRKEHFKRVVILTGTPAPNTLIDLWSQIYLLDRGARLGKTISNYRNSFFTPDKVNGHIVYSYKLKKGADGEIYRKIDDICMSMKADDYLKLPKLINNNIFVEMTDKEKAIYKKLEHDAVVTIGDNEITAINAATIGNKLMQLANGAVYTEDKDIVNIHNHKLEALKEISEDNRLLVFYNYKHDLDKLKSEFKDARVLTDDNDVIDWNLGKIKMLLAHPASAAYGLNLQQGGNIIVWYGLNWSLELYQQANARLYRQGQEKPVIIHHLLTKGTIDEHIIKVLQQKEKRQNELLGALKCMMYITKN